MTHRHRLPRWLAHLVVASVGATMLSAVVLGAPVQAADNATVPPAARVVHGVELATAVAGGAAAPAAVGTPKGRPLTQQEADAVLARAAARSQNSYTKASTAPSGGSLHTAFSAHAITATTPDQTTLADCLSRSGANTLQGQTLNRWFWCRLGGIGIDYFRIVDNEKILEGTATVDFIAAAVGSNTDRTWRAYFHALPGTVRYTPVDPTWEAVAPSLLMTIGGECANLSQYCTTVGSPESWPWSDWNTLDRWSYQDINSSIIGSTGPDDISLHPWYYRFTGSGGGYTVTPAHTAERTVRCDSATYLAWAAAATRTPA